MMPKDMLKWLSLVILVIQNASTILLLRYVRTASGDLFFSTTAIVCQELVKMVVSVVLLYMETFSFTELAGTINQQIVRNLGDTLKTGIPALLYTLQTNLVYLAISNLNAAVFQVTFQIKILTTAIFMVFLLKKSLRGLQWFSLVLLCIGISIIQVQNVNVAKSSADDHKNAFFGLICVILACVLSGLAGVYFEKILKNSKVSIWVRNIQLGCLGTLFALITAYASDGDGIQKKGFFFGYNNLVWLNILVQSAGGLIVAVVIKYADNILKGFATSIAIIVSCLASVYLFDTIIDYIFAFGTFLVVLSVVLYSYTPPPPPVLPSTSNESTLSPLLTPSNGSNGGASENDDQSIYQHKINLLVNNNGNGNGNNGGSSGVTGVTHIEMMTSRAS